MRISNLRDLFLLDPDVVFLNHGSFGACPKPVFETYQAWQRELERQPVRYFQRSEGYLQEARQHLGRYLNTDGDNLIYVTNATFGLNIVARSIPFEPGDEILTTDQEYGAVNKTWEFVCGKTGARIVKQTMPMPVTTAEEFVEVFWAGVTPRTRIISLSHITSPTALIFPIEEICRRAREAGILTVIDGAHAPGQINIDLEAIGADFYTGNCHKWMCAPKGAGFLYTRPEYQAILEPAIVSHGWGNPDSTYIGIHQYQGTRDLAAFLSVPAAIEFQRAYNWDQVRLQCHAIASDVRGRLSDMTGLEPLSPDSPEWFMQMVSIPLPPCDDPAEVSRRLREEYNIEIPFGNWSDQNFTRVRVSIQAYNTLEDTKRLVDALTDLLHL
jgi:isopenicillin-N epimerase